MAPTESPLTDLVQTGPVHLVGADVDEALRPVSGPVGGSQQNSGPVDVDALETRRALE